MRTNQIGRLPDSWDEVAPEPPRNFDHKRISPRDLQQAYEEYNSPFEVAHNLRTERRCARQAAHRLDIVENHYGPRHL